MTAYEFKSELAKLNKEHFYSEPQRDKAIYALINQFKAEVCKKQREECVEKFKFSEDGYYKIKTLKEILNAPEPS